MLRIRLFRVGKKNQPAFRVVVTDKKNPPRGGRFVEILGFFNPLTKEKGIKKERVQYWISQGAQPSDTCHNLFIAEGIIKEAKIPVHAKTKKEPKTDEKEVAEPKTEVAEPKTEVTEAKTDEKEATEPKAEAIEPKTDEKEVAEPKTDEKKDPNKVVNKELSKKEAQEEEKESSESSKEEQGS